MLLYESNYQKLAQLTGVLDFSESHWISRVRNDNDLHIEWLDTEPYTTTLRMTYWLRGGPAGHLAEPNLTVRIYQDAAQVEALSETAAPGRGARFRPLPRDLELARRWQRNMMLNKWLDYLLDRGHGFS